MLLNNDARRRCGASTSPDAIGCRNPQECAGLRSVKSVLMASLVTFRPRS